MSPVRPSKRKVIEMESEPRYTEVAESARNVDLLVSANVDYCKPKIKVASIHFKDTLMLQTRIYESVHIIIVIDIDIATATIIIIIIIIIIMKFIYL